MTNNELALVAILGTSTLIFLTLLYYFYVVKPVKNEQKSESKEGAGCNDFSTSASNFMPIEKKQLKQIP